MHHDIHDGDVAGHVSGSNQSGEDEMFAEAAHACQFLEAVSPGAVANDEEFHLRTAFHELGRDGQQIVVALELEEASDFADDKVSGANAEALAQVRIIL